MGIFVASGFIDDGTQAQAAAQPEWASRHQPMTLPAGIFWERTGGKTHRVTIRREPTVASSEWGPATAWTGPLLGFDLF